MEIALSKCHLIGCITQSQSLPFPVLENESPGQFHGSLSQPATGGGGAGRQRVRSTWSFLQGWLQLEQLHSGLL